MYLFPLKLIFEKYFLHLQMFGVIKIAGQPENDFPLIVK